MAKTTNKKDQKPKKEGFIKAYRGLTDTSGIDGYFRPENQGGRWKQAFELLMGDFAKTMGLNFIMLLFIAPIIYFGYLRFAKILTDAALAPFMSNMGVGYFPVVDMIGREESILYTANFNFFVLVPLMGIWLSVGLAGGLYVARNLAWGENVPVFKTFLRGIKKNFLQMLFATLIYSVVLAVSAIVISFVDLHVALNGGTWYFTVSKIALYVLIAFATIHFMTMASMIVTYDGKFFSLFKNSIIIGGVLSPVNAFYGAIALLPFILLLGKGTMTLGVMVILMLGVSFALIVWTVYSHWIYDKFLNGAVAAHEATDAEIKAHEDRAKGASSSGKDQGFSEVGEQQPAKVVLVKPVTDYDVSMPNLGGAFTRGDIQSVNDSKKQF